MHRDPNRPMTLMLTVFRAQYRYYLYTWILRDRLKALLVHLVRGRLKGPSGLLDMPLNPKPFTPELGYWIGDQSRKL